MYRTRLWRVVGYLFGPQAKRIATQLTRTPLEQGRLGWTHGFPRVDRLAHEGVDRLGRRRAGLMGGHVEQADLVSMLFTRR